SLADRPDPRRPTRVGNLAADRASRVRREAAPPHACRYRAVSPRSARIATCIGLGLVLALVLNRWEPLGLDLLFRARTLVHGIRPVDSRIRLIVVDQEAFSQLGK